MQFKSQLLLIFSFRNYFLSLISKVEMHSSILNFVLLWSKHFHFLTISKVKTRKFKVQYLISCCYGATNFTFSRFQKWRKTWKCRIQYLISCCYEANRTNWGIRAGFASLSTLKELHNSQNLVDKAKIIIWARKCIFLDEVEKRTLEMFLLEKIIKWSKLWLAGCEI